MRFALLYLLLCFTFGTCYPQTPDPAVTVVIKMADAKGAVISGADVVIKSAADRVVGRGTTDRMGETRFPLQQGTYHFYVVSHGFAPLLGNIEVRGSREQRVGLTMQVGNFSGPCCSDLPNLPLIAPEPLTQLLAEAPSRAVIYGRIMDPSGAPIPRAQIVVKSQSERWTYLVADEDGRYRLTVVPADYTVSARSQGFRTGSTLIHLVPGGQGRGDIRLDIGGCTECVTAFGAEFMPCIADQMNTPIATAVVVLSLGKTPSRPDYTTVNLASLHDTTVGLDDWGCGSVQVPPGAYRLSVKAPGFQPIRKVLAITGQTTVTFAMKAGR